MNRLNQAIKELSELEDSTESGKVNIKGKWYTKVDKRVEIFRKHFAEDGRINTEIVTSNLELVCMKATAHSCENGQWRELGTGHAEEYRGENFINKTSALENCETSAIGRCMSNIGLHGGEYASAEEVDNAINNKEEAPIYDAKYKFRKEGEVVMTAKDATTFINQLGDWIKKVTDEEKREAYEKLFLENLDEILKAKEDSQGKIKTRYENLIKEFKEE